MYLASFNVPDILDRSTGKIRIARFSTFYYEFDIFDPNFNLEMESQLVKTIELLFKFMFLHIKEID